MNPGQKPSRWLAGTLAFASFVGATCTFAVMLIIGVGLPGHETGDLLPQFFRSVSEAHLVCIAVTMGLGFAAFVHRAIRHQVSSEAAFHGFFILGVSMLGYCLWAMLSQVQILNRGYVSFFNPTRELQVVLSGPVMCLFVIPAALLLIIVAILYDRGRGR